MVGPYTGEVETLDYGAMHLKRWHGQIGWDVGIKEAARREAVRGS